MLLDAAYGELSGRQTIFHAGICRVCIMLGLYFEIFIIYVRMLYKSLSIQSFVNKPKETYNNDKIVAWSTFD